MPLTQLLRKDVEYVWTPAQQQAFDVLQAQLTRAPVLQPPNWDQPFHVIIDASAFCVAAALSQLDENKKDHPIYYASRQMNSAERNYSMTKREALAVIFLCKNF